MKNVTKGTFLFVLAAIFMNGLGINVLAAQDSIPDLFVYSNHIFKPNIKTVLFHREGWELSPPLMEMNSGEKLLLSFDDLDADGKEYMFTIVHCDADWNPSDLEKYEYIDGYYEDYIYEHRFSANTIVPYAHYELIFPTYDLKPLLSGNYMLKVYVENEDSLSFTRQFRVFEKKVNVEARIKQATDIADRNYKQEIDFTILTGNYQVVNPYRDLKVVIRQNERWDNAIRNLQPKMVISGKLEYNYDRENVFNGVNEFRSADFKSLNYYTENIARIESNYEGYKVVLKPADKRTFRVYKSEDDINGKMLIKTEDYQPTETAAEYVNVLFILNYPVPLLDADMYVLGALSDWNYTDANKMTYNYKAKRYEINMLLKQGYYNYHFVLKYHDQTEGDATFIEGNHWETENDYTIYIYNREQGDFYDSLIGVGQFNSLNP
ncbi:MAG: DUF5103 domain-containing protein [Bacteroidales bacterium]|nr:DUF5103 domain-containing protein [Bacteroidales bacterium]